LKKLKPGN